MSLRDQKWMAWEGGVDLVGATRADLAMPNLIVHVARLVHTPVGSCPAGMMLYQPDPAGDPLVVGFVAARQEVADYFGPAIFAGTPFEQAPAQTAHIEVAVRHPEEVEARVEVGGYVFQVHMRGLGRHTLIHRHPAEATPFFQQGLEATPDEVTLHVNGKAVDFVLPAVGISGGPPAVYAATGLYAR